MSHSSEWIKCCLYYFETLSLVKTFLQPPANFKIFKLDSTLGGPEFAKFNGIFCIQLDGSTDGMIHTYDVMVSLNVIIVDVVF